MDITLVVPAYNEQDSIPDLFKVIANLADSVEFNVSLLLIENGSQDKTRLLIREKSSEYNKLSVEVLELDVNVGYGGALKHGISRATTPVVLILPADGKYQSSDIKRVCESFIQSGEGWVMVKGKRVSRNDPQSIQVLSKLLTWVTNLLFKTNVWDVNGLPKIFNREFIFEDLPIIPDDACFDVGLLACWRKNGGTFHEVPVDFTQKNLDEASWAGKKIRISIRMFIRIVSFFFELQNREK